MKNKLPLITRIHIVCSAIKTALGFESDIDRLFVAQRKYIARLQARLEQEARRQGPLFALRSEASNRLLN